MNYIITGAAGFIGSNLTEHLLKENKIIAIQHHSPVLPNVTSPNLIRLTTDVFKISDFQRMLEDVLKEQNITSVDAFIHLAWGGVAGEKRFIKEIQDTNIQCLVDCVRVCASIGCKKFITCGSIMEFESAIALLNGNYPIHSPIATYCYAKFFSHGIGFNEAIKHNIDFYYPIISNAYGVGDLSNRFINNTLKKIINREELSFSASTQLYDFIYVDDISSAIDIILQKGQPFRNYVLGTGSPRPLKEFIFEMVHLGGDPYPNTVTFGKPVGFSLTDKEYSTANLIEDTGFTPQIKFSEGIRRTYEWLKTLKED